MGKKFSQLFIQAQSNMDAYNKPHDPKPTSHIVKFTSADAPDFIKPYVRDIENKGYKFLHGQLMQYTSYEAINVTPGTQCSNWELTFTNPTGSQSTITADQHNGKWIGHPPSA